MFSHCFPILEKWENIRATYTQIYPIAFFTQPGPPTYKTPLFTGDALHFLYLLTICASLRHVSIVIRLGLIVVCWNTVFIGILKEELGWLGKH